jgi:glycosyltransferase involved in cell wall biosynthesis
MRLRTLAVTSLFPNPVQPTWGIFNARVIEHLAEVSDVRVIAPVKWFPGGAHISREEERLSRVPACSVHAGIEVTHPRVFRTPLIGRSLHGEMYAASIKGHVRRAVEAFRPDVIFASWAHPDGYAMQRLGEELGLPVVIKCLGSDLHQLLGDKGRGPRIVSALTRAARVVTVSEKQRELLVARGVPTSRIDTVYHGVDKRMFHPSPKAEARAALGLPAEGEIVTCVAALLPIKRHVDLIAAFERLRRRAEHRDARLVLVGEGPLRGSLERAAASLGLGEHVRFTGNRPHDEVARWMKAADAVSLASDDEGLPNVLVEALACGRPVVATRVGGIPELVRSEEHGRLVAPRDPAALSEALHDVLSRPWSPEALAACPDVISWEESTERLLATLRAAVEPRRVARRSSAASTASAPPSAP